MAIQQKLLRINGTAIDKLVDYEIEWAKLWKDADRNMEGEVRATLIGLFPKIKCKTRKAIPRAEVATLGNLLNLPFLSVEYYDPLKNTTITAKYYSSDFSTKLQERTRELFYEVSFNLIPISRRA
uniref:Uncharacterized protein n=1 Tax=Siphoviridae sp. ct1SN28 TaxID=2825308 RepID=A0A8S5TRL2_9CAUD|nr:MAG TPA: hypothetical protein [Siphoviridae sp. ct1SN28]